MMADRVSFAVPAIKDAAQHHAANVLPIIRESGARKLRPDCRRPQCARVSTARSSCDHLLYGRRGCLRRPVGAGLAAIYPRRDDVEHRRTRSREAAASQTKAAFTRGSARSRWVSRVCGSVRGIRRPAQPHQFRGGARLIAGKAPATPTTTEVRPGVPGHATGSTLGQSLKSDRSAGWDRKAPAGEMTGALRGSAAIGQAAPGRIRPEHFGGSMASVWPALGSSRDGKPALIALVERLDRKSTFHNGKAPARGDRGEVT
jgi:hypothetical protein